MYAAIYILLILVSIGIIYAGSKRNNRAYIITGLLLALLTALFFWFMNFWGEALWFKTLGQGSRFWTVWWTKILSFIITFIFGGFWVYILTVDISHKNNYLRWGAIILGAIVTGFWWFSEWNIILKFVYGIHTNVTEPILGRDTGFYMFQLPFLKTLYDEMLLLAFIAFIVVIVSNVNVTGDGNSMQFVPFEDDDYVKPYDSLYLSAGFLLLTLAFGKYLARFDLLFSHMGVVAGPGWTDAHIRMPLLLVVAILTAAFAILILLPGFRYRLRRIYSKARSISESLAVLISTGILIGLWIVLLAVIPYLLQWLYVEPNEITVEKPYIKNNIELTRKAFHLDKIEVNEYPATENFSRETVEQNQNLFSNIRLWDYRALDAVFKQFQEIRLYYEFADVDIDRYTIDSTYREVMISAREMQIGNLPAQSQTFVNQRFKYTHGNGIVLTKVNEFTPEGLPNLLIKDIPPQSKFTSLQVDKPQIYYGELTDTHVIVNSSEQEFDYPSGEKNVYITYNGEGGVQMSNLWRKFLFGWKFDGTRLFLSSYPNSKSRIMFHREIKERVNTLAPFLKFDDDPYIVLVDGRLYWMLDAYTTSDQYPYSEPFSSNERIDLSEGSGEQTIYNQVAGQFRGQNYVRNSVKAVIDAYSGKVDLYIYDPDDPVIRVYNKIFPGLFKKKENMPKGIRAHVRYPADMLLVQGLVYAKYHMTDPTVFYNQEDLWVRATEKYYSSVVPVQPYYIMWEPPELDKMEFVLILPFTPKNRQVMIGWIAGMCDQENYGRFLAYKFPKEKRILGPQQVETKIDQDSFLSGQLTLWDQRGSNVIRGNVLAIPVNNTILYVEPIYLQSETAAYPELRLVAIMHNDQLSYAPTFSEALEGIFAESGQQGKVVTEEQVQGNKQNIGGLIRTANQAFRNYLNNMQKRDFESAAKSLRSLENALNDLEEASGKTENDSTGIESPAEVQ